MKLNLKGISVGYTKGATLDKAFKQATKLVEETTGLIFSESEVLKASEGLSPITSGGLDNCLNQFASNLVDNKKVAA